MATAPAPDRPALSRSSPVVSARLTPADRARLADRLDADGMPVGVFVRGLILDALDTTDGDLGDGPHLAMK